MKKSGTPEDQNAAPSRELVALTESIFQVAPETLSTNIRSFLEQVLTLHESPEKAMKWLTSPIAALQGTVPIEELRKGQIHALQEFWTQHEKIVGY